MQPGTTVLSGGPIRWWIADGEEKLGQNAGLTGRLERSVGCDSVAGGFVVKLNWLKLRVQFANVIEVCTEG